jgi:hypothetical protein
MPKSFTLVAWLWLWIAVGLQAESIQAHPENTDYLRWGGKRPW